MLDAPGQWLAERGGGRMERWPRAFAGSGGDNKLIHDGANTRLCKLSMFFLGSAHFHLGDVVIKNQHLGTPGKTTDTPSPQVVEADRSSYSQLVTSFVF